MSVPVHAKTAAKSLRPSRGLRGGSVYRRLVVAGRFDLGELRQLLEHLRFELAGSPEQMLESGRRVRNR